MNHKRGRPKDRRAGCLLCKPSKSNGVKGADRVARNSTPPENPRVSNGRFYDWCPDCDGTGRCNCGGCKGETCLLCSGTRIMDCIEPREAG